MTRWQKAFLVLYAINVFCVAAWAALAIVATLEGNAEHFWEAMKYGGLSLAAAVASAWGVRIP